MSGRQMGYVGNNGNYDVTYFTSRHQRQTAGGPGTGSFADFDLAHDHINSYEQGARGGVYTAHAGDTLSGIAANLWGDASLWYKIAEVNGLTAESVLIEGQPLLIPTGVQRNENNAATFQPYDPLEVLGNTSPTSPTPSNVKECGTVGKIMLAVLVYAVAIYVDPYLANLVQQGVMMATGHQEEFSWEQFAVATITAGVTSYVSGGYGGVNVGQTAASQMTSNAAAQEIVGAAVNGAVGSAVSQGVSMALGIQDKFSWSAVAGAAVGAAAGAWAVPQMRLNAIADRHGAMSTQFASASFIRASANGVANAATRSLMNNGDFGDNMLAALPDVIGQTMGAVAGAMAGPESVDTEAPSVSKQMPQTAKEVAGLHGCEVGDAMWSLDARPQKGVTEKPAPGEDSSELIVVTGYRKPPIDRAPRPRKSRWEDVHTGYVDAMGNYYPGTGSLPGHDYNPLEHPGLTAGMMVGTLAAPYVLTAGGGLVATGGGATTLGGGGGAATLSTVEAQALLAMAATGLGVYSATTLQRTDIADPPLPLPGFEPTPPMPWQEGYDAADPLPRTPGYTPAPQMPANEGMSIPEEWLGPQILENSIGRITPSGLHRPGYTNFGREMEAGLPGLLEARHPDTVFTYRLGGNRTGPDASYESGVYPGFDHIELSRGSPNGADKVLGQVSRWQDNPAYGPGIYQALFYDDMGNVYTNIDDIPQGAVRVPR